MELDLNTLEIRILLKCNEKLLSRTYLAPLYNKYSLKERRKAIEHLIKEKYIIARELPKPGAKVVPVFYEITEKGKKWVRDYLDNYPD